MRRIFEQLRDDLSALDRKAIFALVYAAFGLSAIYYLRSPEPLAAATRGTAAESFGNYVAFSSADNLPALIYWVVVVTVFYVVLPSVAIKFYFRERLSDFGLTLGIENGFWQLLGACIAVMLPIVYLVSLTSGFSAKYPFLQIRNGGHYIGWTLLVWELFYFVQFFGLEFFFRGFLIHSLKPAIGKYAIFAMTVPYCMIHFGKLPAETFAAIVAGVFLGWLSYRSGSILLGLILHCTVALAMDILALMNKGHLF
jgi:membrane protease YdiL (CAAX protease family)